MVFFLGPAILLDVGVEVVVPTLATLLANATFDVLSDLAPILSAVQLDLLHEKPVFFLSPRAFDHFRIEHFLPSVQALDIGSELQAFSDPLPVFGSHLPDQFS